MNCKVFIYIYKIKKYCCFLFGTMLLYMRYKKHGGCYIRVCGFKEVIGMKKMYSQPEIEIRKYAVSSNGVTTSNPSANEKNDLNRDDGNGDYFCGIPTMPGISTATAIISSKKSMKV